MRIFIWSCGTANRNRTHIVGKYVNYKENQDVLVEDMRKLGQCYKEMFGRLFVEFIEDMISIQCDRL